MATFFSGNKFRIGRWGLYLAVVFTGFQYSCQKGQAGDRTQNQDLKPRLLVLTDIGGDPDDQQSLVRLALYFNEFEMEGFIASASGIPGELEAAVVKPHLIEKIVEAYGEVRSNLLLHDADYPDPHDLLEKIKSGNPDRGLDYIGEDHDTEGSEWIIQVVDRSDERPVNIAIWGGQTDLFQALWKVKNTRSAADYDAFVQKMRIYDIADQDNILDQVIADYPGLFYIRNKARDGEDKRNAIFRGMYLGGDESLTSMDWIQTHVQQDHGPLGALYPLKTWTAPNPHGVLKEGDTPSWFYFLPRHPGHPDHPEWGGWGGRFTPAEFYFVDASDQMDGTTSARATVWRWRPHFQNEFQARMDWCVKSPAEANHSPVAVVEIPATPHGGIAASPESIVQLSAMGSSDPDGDSLTYFWYVYPEAGSGWCDIQQPDSPTPRIHIPGDVPAGSEIHLILEVTDDGLPPLTSYRRVIIHVD